MIADGAWEHYQRVVGVEEQRTWDYFLMWPQGRLFYLNPEEMKPVKLAVVSVLPAPHMGVSTSLGGKQAPRCGGLNVQCP